MNEPKLPLWVIFLLSVCLALSTFLIVLDYSIANVSLPYIAGDLGVSNDQGTYVITSFAVGNAIGLPLTGWLTKRLGAIPLITLSLLLFTFFSWTCGAAWSFPMLVSSRALQGFVAGPLIPLSQTLIVTINPPAKRNGVLALWSTVAVVGPILGPILGGYLSFNYTWRWIFYINIPVGIVCAFVIWLFLKQQERNIIREALDSVGLLFLALSMGFLQLLLDKGEQYDWWRSPWIVSFGVISLISFVFLLVWSRTTEKPLVEVRLFKIFSYSLSFPFILIMYGIYMGSVVLVPLWLQEYMGYDATLAGLAVCPIGLAPLFLAHFVAKALSWVGSKKLLITSFMLFAASCFYTAFFDTTVDMFHVGLSRFFLGFGIAFFITPLFAFNIQDMPQKDLPSSAGLFHLVRAMAGAIGTSIFTTLWIRRTSYHHQVLGETVTPFAPQWKMYAQDLDQLGLKAEKALAFFNNTLDTQAAMLAINDCFYVMGFLFLAMIPLCFLMKDKKQKVSSLAVE